MRHFAEDIIKENMPIISIRIKNFICIYIKIYRLPVLQLCLKSINLHCTISLGSN